MAVTISDYSGTTETDAVTNTGTSLQHNGRSTTSIHTADSISSSTYTMLPRSGSALTITTALTSFAFLSYDGTRVLEPSCKLFSIISQCASQWEDYIESELIPSPTASSDCDVYQGSIPALTWEPMPACVSTYDIALTSYWEQLFSVAKSPCTQTGGDLCRTVKDTYVHQQNSNFLPDVSFASYFSNDHTQSTPTNPGAQHKSFSTTAIRIVAQQRRTGRSSWCQRLCCWGWAWRGLLVLHERVTSR